jgi:hypothetical protein
MPVMAMHLKTPCPVMRTPTRFHSDEERWQRRNKTEHFTPSNALPEDHRTFVIHSNDVKYQLCDVDPEYTHLLCHWTRSFVVNDCSQFRNHSGSSQPY